MMLLGTVGTMVPLDTVGTMVTWVTAVPEQSMVTMVPLVPLVTAALVVALRARRLLIHRGRDGHRPTPPVHDRGHLPEGRRGEEHPREQPCRSSAPERLA